jgi:hypothetical protein
MEFFESTPYILNQKLDFIKRENKPSLNDYYQAYDNLNTTLPEMKYHFSYLKKQVKGLNDTLNASFFGNFSINSTIINNTQSQSFFTYPNVNFSSQMRYNEVKNIPNNNYHQNNNYNIINNLNMNNYNNNINNVNNPLLNNNYPYQIKSTDIQSKNDLEKGVQERNLLFDKYEDLFKEGYNKLTNLKIENSTLKDNLNKMKSDNINEEEENEDYPDLNNVKKILKSKIKYNDIPKSNDKNDWNELSDLKDEINNLRKENLKNQQKYENKLNELKNKIEELENKLENQNE